ncbi:Hypothetical protein LUCI_2508 [Lucifera butyrica]|uniref:Uncharacterized protein n=1 Tax=Lucifera butyrica TaxID=1351585 RepID=A0A498R6Z2_9FIRM|nr:hypothetical protein [Lucifera butyrica]VBB07264.1 Hypothetical protein LUCI_2508 [Lucifera butyrica]
MVDMYHLSRIVGTLGAGVIAGLFYLFWEKYDNQSKLGWYGLGISCLTVGYVGGIYFAFLSACISCYVIFLAKIARKD